MEQSAAAASKIQDSLKPATDKESMQRAGVFTFHLSRTCVDDLTKLLADIKGGAYGNELKDVFASLKQESFWPAAKELICVSAYLTAVDQGVTESTHWLSQLISHSLAATDKVIEYPTSSEIMELHAGIHGAEAVCNRAALSICHQLGFGPHATKAAEAIEKYLKMATGYRADLLTYVLTQPVSVLVESTKTG
ncbi:MAG TPA: hypothetical protein V6D17_05215 [Candidatus Obscuribacterales bacterium]